MGVNMAGYCIMRRRRVLRRRQAGDHPPLLRHRLRAAAQGLCAPVETRAAGAAACNQLGLTAADRPVVGAALRARRGDRRPRRRPSSCPTARSSPARPLPCSARARPACSTRSRRLGGIPKDVTLISPEIIEPIQHLKVEHLGNHNPRLHTDEVLVALCICAVTDPTAEIAMQQLEKLRALRGALVRHPLARGRKRVQKARG